MGKNFSDGFPWKVVLVFQNLLINNCPCPFTGPNFEEITLPNNIRPKGFFSRTISSHYLLFKATLFTASDPYACAEGQGLNEIPDFVSPPPQNIKRQLSVPAYGRTTAFCFVESFPTRKVSDDQLLKKSKTQGACYSHESSDLSILLSSIGYRNKILKWLRLLSDNSAHTYHNKPKHLHKSEEVNS